MSTCAEVLAATLRDAGITRIFGLPGGEVLDFMEAARRAGIEFLLTRHEATASLMADVTGQIQRRPGVCLATLGPGAVNMTLGVANAYLERSPVIAITATLARSKSTIATHQDLDLNAVYRPFTKLAITLDGRDTAAKVRHAIDVSMTPRMGPVHIALPSDVARTEEPAEPLSTRPAEPIRKDVVPIGDVVSALAAVKRPVAILGNDLNPHVDPPAVRKFVETLALPVFVTPKAKGLFPEDHPLFYGVCAGVSADSVVVKWLERADVLLGVGFDPVESDKTWHYSLKTISIGPVPIGFGDFHPVAEAAGDVSKILQRVQRDLEHNNVRFSWTPDDRAEFRSALEVVLRPFDDAQGPRRGLSGYELTRCLRDLFPRDTVFVTDVGSVKMVTSQAWTSYEPLTFFESNGLSAMSYSLPAAMAARLQFPNRPILCTIGDGGFGMTLTEIETCVRERLHFVTVVFNDNSLSLIDVAQQRRGYPTSGVRYGDVDFAAMASAMGAWARRVETLESLDAAIRDSRAVDRPIVIDAVVDPAEYLKQTAG